MNRFQFANLFLIAFLASSPALADSAEESLKKGKEALEELKIDEAIMYLTEAIRKEPKNVEAFYHRGRAYSEALQTDKAIADFSEAIRLNPKFADAFSDRGVEYRVKRDYVKAIADQSEAIRLDAKHQRAWPQRAIVYYELGEYAKALADHEQAIRLAPKNASVLVEVAQVLAVCPDEKYRDGKKAVEYATEACKVSKWEFYPAIEALAAAHAELGQFDEAVKSQKKAMEVISSDGISSLVKNAEERLKQYEKRKPLRYRSMTFWIVLEANQK